MRSQLGELGIACVLAGLAGCGGGPTCVEHADCAEDERCVMEVCVPETMPDAGDMDAGDMDAGDMDAAVSDAGPRVDAGGLDAGADAGERDGGRVDAGSDAGEADAGAADGGGTDASPADGGTEDGGTDAGPACPSAILCGTPAVCCAAGEECLGGTCVTACPSGVRCSATCCAAAQACVSGSCVDLGSPCTDSFACASSEYCDVSLGVCLAQFSPLTCTRTPMTRPFAPILEWSVTAPSAEPTHVNSVVTPLVVDLDGDGLPEVISLWYPPATTGCRGSMRVIDGATGAVEWTVRDVGGVDLAACATPAVGDLDGAGVAEIVTMRSDGRIVALRADGTVMWLSEHADGSPYSAGTFLDWSNAAFALADLDGDASPEIIIGAVVLDASGVLLWERDGGTLEGDNDGYNGGLPVVADIDLDGAPEIVTGRRAYEANGTTAWLAMTVGGGSVTDGYPAVADFDTDAQPEIVLVTQGSVYLLDGMTGLVEWGPEAIPGGGRGGPPIVADFDGDGAPEIGVAGGSRYAVFDPAETTPLLWSRPTRDLSSNATGSAVFDFEGDGLAEVIYADECYLRAYRGTDGAVLLEVPSSSGTQHEYPVVADVDGDGSSEILVVANDNNATAISGCVGADSTWSGERHGLFAYGDAFDEWVRTRRVWNQHTYHVTNVTSDGAIPVVEADSWATADLNSYRQNVQGSGLLNAVDLYPASLAVVLSGCPGFVTLRARVGNAGNAGAPAGIPVSFREGTLASPGALLGTVRTTAPLVPGGTEAVELHVPLSGAPPFGFIVQVDEDGAGGEAVVECDETNNEGGIGGVSCG